jgi:hypothetical protein
MDELLYDKKTENKNVKVNLAVGKLWANVKLVTGLRSRLEPATPSPAWGTVYRVNVEEDKSALVKVYDGSVYGQPAERRIGEAPRRFQLRFPFPGRTR